ncbi:MAG: nicotinate-nucleotide--dimethylbenzimidazole phosphoribosyltransferase [Lachnospiraceae bacterium]|nr:nicotinate-nucleotide--dimethylbenzimidazole phosphoribosyltransferase [Lachnospiraceae bacterium]
MKTEILDLIRNIKPADKEAACAASRHWDSLAKPLGSLGVLEDDIIRIAALTGREDVRLAKRTLLVFCADNGVVEQGVSQSGHEVTAAVAAALGRHESTTNYMASETTCEVVPVDIGMRDDTPYGVICAKIRRGTQDISSGPAMNEEECVRAIITGADMVRRYACTDDEKRSDIILLGEMGIGNTTTSAAVASVMLGLDPGETAGRGAGLSDAGLVRKADVIRRAIEVNRPVTDDPVDVLAKVGGFDIAAMCGACIGGAMYRVPVLLDGFISNAAALAAVKLCPHVRDALIASHVSAEPAAAMLLKEMKLEPCISAGLRLGEGSGAVLALALLDRALAVYHSGNTFGALGIEAYTRKS